MIALQKQHSNQSQTARILRMFKERGELTNRELNLVCYRYGARIHELRREGHKIISLHEKDSLWRFIYVSEPCEHDIHINECVKCGLVLEDE